MKNESIKWKLLNNEQLTEDELIVNGYLDLSGVNITSLPEGFYVTGDLYLNHSNNAGQLCS